VTAVSRRGLSQPGENSFPPFAPRHFCIIVRQRRSCASAAGNRVFFPSPRPPAVRTSIGLGPHLARSRFQTPEQDSNQWKSSLFGGPSTRRKRVGTEEKFPLGEVQSPERDPFGVAESHVVAFFFCDAIDAHVHLGARWAPNGGPLAQEEVRVAPQGLRPVDRVVSVMVLGTCSSAFSVIRLRPDLCRDSGNAIPAGR